MILQASRQTPLSTVGEDRSSNVGSRCRRGARSAEYDWREVKRDTLAFGQQVLGTTLRLSAALAIAGCGDDSASIEPVPVVNITVTPDTAVLTTGSTTQLTAAVQDLEGRPLPGREITWSSSAPETAAVSAAGVVTALAPGKASIGAHSEQSVGFGEVVVQPNFRLPVIGERSWLVITETGSLAGECSENEGGLRIDGGRDCTHAGLSRYSLDLADAEQWAGALPGAPATEVHAAAEGTIIDICIQPPTEITCGPNGPFVLVEHPGGFTTLYAHLDPSSVTLRRKTRVLPEQPLGTMGAWGADPAPWLHFELRYENAGAAAASVIEAAQLSGRPILDYRLGPIHE
jgi:hypothetical protein